jgi:hypothetical protein
MKIQVRVELLIVLMLILATSVRAQKPGWKQETTKDGKVQVSYYFDERKDEKGKKYTILEYEARTRAQVSLESCLAVLKDDSRHKEFMEDTEYTERIRAISENEWLSYYRLRKRWPMPEADVVTRYTLKLEPDKKRFVLTGNPAPEMHPDQGVERMQESYSTYTVTDLGNGQSEIITYSRSIPVVSIPKMLMATWFPNGPAKMVNGIIQLAQELE